MAFRSLYARLLVLFLAVLLIAMMLLSVLLYQRIRADKMDARLNELTVQAKDIAYLAGQRVGLGILDAATNRYLLWKSREIMQEFDAVIIIMDRTGEVIPIGDSTMEYTYDFSLEELVMLIGHTLSGETVIDRMVLDTGNPVFTVGVPYMVNDQVLGAVFIRTSEQSIEASYKAIVTESIQSMLLALSIGAVLILIVSRLITRPMRQMAQAADRFARGDFEQRVPVSSRDEIGRLAESFNRMAEDLGKLEQTRREFVANVSHELRSPLTSIQGFINGILDGTVPETERDHYLGIVLEETRRLSKLISTLLELSQMDSGEAAFVKERFDVHEMMYRVLFRQETRIEAKGLDVQIYFQDEACMVHAAPDRIEQVLVNLIDNAVKYGRENGCLLVSTKRENGHVRITVGDDGQGIATEDLPHVFDRFYMADKAHTSGTGTGLGLSIAKSIIDQHGQTIDVTSAPGEGTTFSFTLDAG